MILEMCIYRNRLSHPNHSESLVYQNEVMALIVVLLKFLTRKHSEFQNYTTMERALKHIS